MDDLTPPPAQDPLGPPPAGDVSPEPPATPPAAEPVIGEAPAAEPPAGEPPAVEPPAPSWGAPPSGTLTPSPSDMSMPAAEPPPTTESPPPPSDTASPPTPATGETLVIPPSSAENPFIPQNVAGETPGVPPAAPAGKSMLQRISTLLIILLVLAGLAVGGKFAWDSFGGAKEVTITYWGLWENDTTVKTLLTDFETQNPKIKVQYVKQSPRQYRERLQAAIARGEGPDVFRFHNTWVPMLRNELMPAPADVMTTAEFGSAFYPVAVADLVGGESIYGIPIMMDGLGLYYNEELLSTAGVTPPTTWPELLDVVPKLTVKTETEIQKSAIALGTTGNVENFSDILALMFMQNGARPANPVGKEAEDTLLFYRKFASPSDPVYTWSAAMDNSIYAFATGRVAMIIAPSWRAFDIKQISPTLKFKIVPVPQLPGNTVTWASYWVEGVSTKSKNPEQSWAFVKYLTSRESATKLYTEAAKTRLFGEPYARVELGTTIADDPYAGAYVKQAGTAKSFPLASRTFDNGLNDKLIKYMEDAINSLATGAAPVAALETASAGFKQVLTSYGLSTGAAPATTP